MLNISWIEGNTTKNYTENEVGKLVPGHFLFFKKALYILGKSKWSAAWFYYISISLKLAYNRNKLFKILHYQSRDMLNFDFLDKDLGIISSAYFAYDFSTKMLLMLYSTNWSNFHCLVAFTSWAIGQYVYCNCLLARLWRHKFQNYDDLSRQAVFIHDQKSQDKNLNILRMKRAFKVK